MLLEEREQPVIKDLPEPLELPVFREPLELPVLLEGPVQPEEPEQRA